MTIRTPRLTLVSASLRLLDAELHSPAALGVLLGASVSPSWPPGEFDAEAAAFFRSKIIEEPSNEEWYVWYAITNTEVPALVCAAGFFGPPDPNGEVQIGYSVTTEHRRSGYATEVVRALTAFAFETPNVTRVIARTTEDNPASMRVLDKAGFARVAVDHGPREAMYILRRPEGSLSPLRNAHPSP